tara:strand:- start:2795 stop:3154 length:360 start_codon:yes stop_codon:yes gene_type:complete
MKTITFHRNLNATHGNAWTFIKDGTTTQATTLVAHNVTIKQPSGKKFLHCLNGGKRGVFAWFKTKQIVANDQIALPLNAKRIRFNPKHGDTYFHIDGTRVDSLRVVFCLSSGACYGIEH